MENVNPISVPRAEAESLYREYVDALRRKRTDFLHDLKVAYGHMRHGRAVIDVWDALKATGLDGHGDPKIAVAPADAKTVFFQKFNERWPAMRYGGGSWRGHMAPNMIGRFSANLDSDRHTVRTAVDQGDVFAPRETYGQPNAYAWKYAAADLDANGAIRNDWAQPLRTPLKAPVPIIPARFIPNGSLHGYHILWEVDRWEETSPPRRDPMLLKRINANSFVVIAAWELTDLERAILRGRLV